MVPVRVITVREEIVPLRGSSRRLLRPFGPRNDIGEGGGDCPAAWTVAEIATLHGICDFGEERASQRRDPGGGGGSGCWIAFRHERDGHGTTVDAP